MIKKITKEQKKQFERDMLDLEFEEFIDKYKEYITFEEPQLRDNKIIQAEIQLNSFLLFKILKELKDDTTKRII
jgi:hypothetical protein